MTRETDRYWCNLGCGFVDRNHRCEQWCKPLKIPGEAIAKIAAAERDDLRRQVKKWRATARVAQAYNGIQSDQLMDAGRSRRAAVAAEVARLADMVVCEYEYVTMAEMLADDYRSCDCDNCMAFSTPEAE